jgi:hypothetical protein
MGIRAMKRKWLVFLLAGISLSLLLIFGLLGNRSGITVSGQIQPSSTPEKATSVYPEAALVDSFEEALQDQTLDPETRKSLEEKLSMAQQMLKLREQAKVNQPGSTTDIEPPKQGGDPVFQSGIFEGGEGLFRSSEAVIENHWQAVLDEKYIQVFAGVSGSDPSQGVVYIVTTAQDRIHTDIKMVLSQPNSGSLKIVGEENLVLTLENQDGTVYQFDIQEKTFLP